MARLGRIVAYYGDSGTDGVEPDALQRLITLENELSRLHISPALRDLTKLINDHERNLIGTRALINRKTIEITEFVEHFRGMHSLLLLLRRHDYVDAGQKLRCRMMVNVSALQRCLPTVEEPGTEEVIKLLGYVVSVRRLYRCLQWPDSQGTINKLDACVQQLAERVGTDSANDMKSAAKEEDSSEIVACKIEKDRSADVGDIKKEENQIMEDVPTESEEISPQQEGLLAPDPISSSPLVSLFAERAARFEGSERAQRLADRAEARAKAEARKAAVAADPTKTEQRKYAEEMKKMKEKEKIQKSYVLKQIEDDKRARMERIRQERIRLGLLKEDHEIAHQGGAAIQEESLERTTSLD